MVNRKIERGKAWSLRNQESQIQLSFIQQLGLVRLVEISYSTTTKNKHESLKVNLHPIPILYSFSKDPNIKKFNAFHELT